MNILRYMWILIIFCAIFCGYVEAINIDLTSGHSNQEHSLPKPNVITYNSDSLLKIRDAVKHIKDYNTLPISVVQRIRSLKLQKKRKRGQRGGYQQRRRKMMAENESLRTVNLNNLISINTTHPAHTAPGTNSKYINIGLVNTRSVKNKDIWLKQVLTEEDVDLCVLTETWLNDNDQWI